MLINRMLLQIAELNLYEISCLKFETFCENTLLLQSWNQAID